MVSGILLSYGVPCYSINRIIVAVLHERTSVRWSGKRTKSLNKSEGVKQGCPISPFIFMIILHCAIERVCSRRGIHLDYAEILLPILLAYADDLIIISDSIGSLDGIFGELIVELQTIGFNEQKCCVLVRDPKGLLGEIDESVVIGGMPIPRVWYLL